MTASRNQTSGTRSYAMLIDAHGNRISLKRFNLLLTASLIIALGALLVAGFILYRDHQRQASMDALQNELADVRRQLEGAANDVALLSAQMAFITPSQAPDAAETTVTSSPPKDAPTSKPASKPESKPAPKPASEPAPKPAPESAPAPAPRTQSPATGSQTVEASTPQPAASADPAQTDGAQSSMAASAAVAENSSPSPGGTDIVPGVAGVDGFKASLQDTRLQVQFRVRNHGSRAERISGNLFCVIKGSDLDPQFWQILPGGRIEDGVPAETHKGYSFSIRNFRTVHLKTAPLDLNRGYNQAQVWIYSKAGALLFSRTYPLNLGIPQNKQPVSTEKENR